MTVTRLYRDEMNFKRFQLRSSYKVQNSAPCFLPHKASQQRTKPTFDWASPIITLLYCTIALKSSEYFLIAYSAAPIQANTALTRNIEYGKNKKI